MEQIFVTVNNERIELTGKAKDDFLAQSKIDADYALEKQRVAEQTATDKAALLAKLGITADEAKLLLS